MSGLEAALAAIGKIGGAGAAERIEGLPLPQNTLQANGLSFADMLVNGIEAVEGKVAAANSIANAFVLDDNIPVHQVTFALEEARLSLELALQIRNRMTDAYQQLMGMQL